MMSFPGTVLDVIPTTELLGLDVVPAIELTVLDVVPTIELLGVDVVPATELTVLDVTTTSGLLVVAVDVVELAGGAELLVLVGFTVDEIPADELEDAEDVALEGDKLAEMLVETLTDAEVEVLAANVDAELVAGAAVDVLEGDIVSVLKLLEVDDELIAKAPVDVLDDNAPARLELLRAVDELAARLPADVLDDDVPAAEELLMLLELDTDVCIGPVELDEDVVGNSTDVLTLVVATALLDEPVDETADELLCAPAGVVDTVDDMPMAPEVLDNGIDDDVLWVIPDERLKEDVPEEGLG